MQSSPWLIPHQPLFFPMAFPFTFFSFTTLWTDQFYCCFYREPKLHLKEFILFLKFEVILVYSIIQISCVQYYIWHLNTVQVAHQQKFSFHPSPYSDPVFLFYSPHSLFPSGSHYSVSTCLCLSDLVCSFILLFQKYRFHIWVKSYCIGLS